jgi:X-X-X-Leu-X-X-Gly heptad repeat protein
MPKERPPLEEMTLRQLRKVASVYNISRYSRMRKDQLLTAIKDVQHTKLSTSTYQPEVEAQEDVEATKFELGQEDLTGGTLAAVDESLPDLPDGYGESLILLMPRDPQWAFTYWDVPNDHKEQLRSQGGQQLALRLYDVTDIRFEYQAPHSIQEYPCDELAREWYLPIPVSDRDYVVDIGYRCVDGRWLVLARSAPVRVPPIYPSDWIDDQFITVDWNEDLRGKSFVELMHPGMRLSTGMLHGQMHDIVKDAEAQRVAGSVFGSMQQVPGSAQVVTGSAQMVTGSAQMVTGSAQMVTGSAQMVTGSAQMVTGSAQMVTGSAQMITGSAQMIPGSGQMVTGSAQMIPGSVHMVTGSAQMVTGSAQMVTGSAQMVTGSAQMVTGSGQMIPGSVHMITGSAQMIPGSVHMVTGSAQMIPGSVHMVTGSAQMIPGSVHMVTGSAQMIPGSVHMVTGSGQMIPGSVHMVTGSGQMIPGSAQMAVSSYVFPSGVGMWAVPTVSGLTMSGVGFSASAPPIRPREFWLVADAELIIYGATEPDATLTIGGRPIKLNPDGTFRFQMSFQDGLIDYPIMAVAVDGEQTRSIHMKFTRETPSRHTNTKEESVAEWLS